MPINHNYLLQGKYEADILNNNRTETSSQFDFGYNEINRQNPLYTPFVDIDNILKGRPKPQWPEGKKFAVCVSHDVDLVSTQSIKQLLRTIPTIDQPHLLPKKLFTTLLNIGKLAFTHKRLDPLHSFERWLESEHKFNAKSTFYFWPGYSNVTKRHPTDCCYDLSDRIYFEGKKIPVKEMIKEIDIRGWEIGLHASWHSFDDADELRQQKDALESILGHEIVSIRQHYLHYDIRHSPSIHQKAGFKYDSTLGFNDNIGFRFGTSYPWRLFDLSSNNQLSILEIPLVIQDGALLHKSKGMRLTQDIAFEYIEQIMLEIKEVGGVLTILWHPHSILRPDWWALFNRSLNLFQQHNAWITSTKQIGEFWTSENEEVH